MNDNKKEIITKFFDKQFKEPANIEKFDNGKEKEYSFFNKFAIVGLNFNNKIATILFSVLLLPNDVIYTFEEFKSLFNTEEEFKHWDIKWVDNCFYYNPEFKRMVTGKEASLQYEDDRMQFIFDNLVKEDFLHQA